MKLKPKIDRLPQFQKAIRDLVNKQVMVGIPSTKAERKDDDPREPINNAQIGYIAENGAPEANIPPRPWLHPGIDSVRTEIADGLRKTAEAALKGGPEAVTKGMMRIGLIGQNAARKKITDGPFIPLKPQTLAARKRRGRTGEKPLIDTGQFRQAVSFVIRPKPGV